VKKKKTEEAKIFYGFCVITTRRGTTSLGQERICPAEGLCKTSAANERKKDQQKYEEQITENILPHFHL